MLLAISNFQDRNPQIQKIQESNQEDLKNNKLSIHWVPAHKGIVGNELADALAKEATTKTPIENKIKLPISYIKKEAIIERNKKWQQEWTNATQGRLTHEVIQNVSTEFLSENPAINCFLTGHGPFLTYLKKFQKIEKEECVCGEGVGNSQHYLLYCPLTTKWHVRTPTELNKELWVKSLIKNKTIKNKIASLSTWLNERNT